MTMITLGHFPRYVISNTSYHRIYLAVIVYLLVLVHGGSCLQCYHCLERPRSSEKHLSCAYFDMSSKFHKECTESTFCMKRTSVYQLHNGTFATIYVHKCADQSHRTMVQDQNGDWNWANLLRLDLYNEGCYRHHTPSLLTTDTSHCFCTTDFCNSATGAYSATSVLTCLLLSSLLLSLFTH